MKKSLKKISDGWLLRVRLTPKASHNKIGDWALDADEEPFLKIYVTAVPEDNKANDALIKLLAKELKMAKSDVEIISGPTNRSKLIKFTQLTQALERLCS